MVLDIARVHVLPPSSFTIIRMLIASNMTKWANLAV